MAASPLATLSGLASTPFAPNDGISLLMKFMDPLSPIRPLAKEAILGPPVTKFVISLNPKSSTPSAVTTLSCLRGVIDVNAQ